MVFFVSCEKSGSDSNHSADKDSPHSVRSTKRSARNEISDASRRFRIAIDLAMKLESSEARDQALAGIVRDALQSAPALSAEAFRNLSAKSSEKPQLLKYCVKLMVERGLDEALEWAASLDQDKDAAKIEIAVVVAESDPGGAGDILSANGVDLGKNKDGFDHVVQNWVSNSPSDAAQWAFSIPAGESRQIAIRSVVSLWLMTDSQSAFSWISDLKVKSGRDEASQAIVKFLSDVPPPSRESILESADESLRSELEGQLNLSE